MPSEEPCQVNFGKCGYKGFRVPCWQAVNPNYCFLERYLWNLGTTSDCIEIKIKPWSPYKYIGGRCLSNLSIE